MTQKNRNECKDNFCVPQLWRFFAAALRGDALLCDVLLRAQLRPTDAAESRAILDPESIAGK